MTEPVLHMRITLLLFLVAFTGCIHSSSNAFTDRWDFKGIEVEDQEAFIATIKQPGKPREDAFDKLLNGNKLILRGNKTYDLALFKQYSHGTWQYAEESSELILTSETGLPVLRCKTEIPRRNKTFIRLDSTALQAVIPAGMQDNVACQFLLHQPFAIFELYLDKEHFSSLANDPYSLSNNQWRVKPNKKETEEELVERIKKHIHFRELLYKDALNNERDYISLNWFTTPLRISFNGASLKDYDEVGKFWEQNFYDSTQAITAYGLMKHCFDKQIETPYPDDQYKNNLHILQQMLYNLDQSLHKKH